MNNSSPKTIAVLGATSAIAVALSRLHATRGDKLILCARNEDALSAVAMDLNTRGHLPVSCINTDFSNPESYNDIASQIQSTKLQVDIWYVCYGTLPDQSLCEQSAEESLNAIHLNFTSVVQLLTPIANVIEQQQRGTLVVISSVAGDRGRLSNYVYGASKGALSIFLQGLRNRLHHAGGHVLTVKPGFVSTPMTAHLDQSGPLWATPEKVALQIYRAVKKKKHVLYTPWFWQPILLVIKCIPEVIFKRLRF